MDRIVIGLDPLPPRPRKPSRPRRPREMFRRTECVWTSEDDDILLADVLHLIPGGVLAQDIRISVDRNPMTGYPIVGITYDHDIPNTRYQEQLRDFETRLARYETELPEWERRDLEWQQLREHREGDLRRLEDEIGRALDGLDDVAGVVI